MPRHLWTVCLIVTVGVLLSAGARAGIDPRGTTARQPGVTGLAGDDVAGADAAADLAEIGGPAARPAVLPGSFGERAAQDQASGWVLVDADSFSAYLAVGQALDVRYYSLGDSLAIVAPVAPLTGLAWEAIEYAPTWLRLDLLDAFRRMDSTHQDLLAGVILAAEDPIVDEVAFAVAHTAPGVLQAASFHTELLTENADYVYANAAYLDYADIMDYGSAAAGGDYYSTLRYRTAAAGETLEVTLPRERYYWDVVHPKVTDEFPTYIDPSTGVPADPPTGKFWRDFLFAYADSGYPVLKDQLAGCLTLWEGNVDSRTNGAVGILTQWILDVMDFGSGAERPIQPVRIYRKHLGRCGEHADITAAAARAALIPTNSASAMDNDHTWNEFWDRRWIAWEPVNVYVDSPWHYEGWGMEFLGAFDWRGDDGVWTVTERYTPACTLTVSVTDSSGCPIDGAQVTIARKTDTITYIESTWGSTDHTGTCTFVLGDSESVYARIDSDLGTIPPGPLFKPVVSPTVAGEHYTWNRILPNRRPSLPALPASPPVGGDIEYRLDIAWEAADEFIYGANRIDGHTFSDHLAGGAVEFFICDQPNYELYAASDTFWAFEIAEDACGGSVAFEVPTYDVYHVIFSNQEHVVGSQAVRGTAELYYRSMSDVAGRGGAAPRLSLGAGRPNPVETQSLIAFEVPRGGPVDLAVYDISGRWVRTLVSGSLDAGEHRATWDGRDSRGRRVAPGIYLCRLVAAGGSMSRKLAVID
ncbi:MAG: FlgD immunoglobulin-like domain containing protein [bacterium]